MEIKPLEVYAEDSNYAIIKPPGRKSPGCVVQGDSLFSLFSLAKSVAEKIKADNTDHEDFLYDVEELLDLLFGRLMHYQEVLDQHGISLPYIQPVQEEDFIKLTPEEDGQA